MTTAEIVLSALWVLLAVGVGLNWRAQIRWQRHFEERLGQPGVTPSPVRYQR